MNQTSSLTDQQKFIIVPKAKKGMWEHYYGRDPSITPMPKGSSVFYKLLGQVLKVKPDYNSIEEAQEDLEKLLELDPDGGFVISVLDVKSIEKPYLHYENKLTQVA